ncbi:uncharacterized protein LY89DRAFT_152094 [Mollisia scopiformis]|uniref:Uncharacterized protein n=1 Tax=Mollisia scopiformis TaxID=149040 RepID=A0A194X1G7_MOLSC|nr:uncharacterized protein LY89DRAFT_152094 [Mollisia scopiformis]KUJ14033.1 hypothetical protein LY89DRAFT_152094 [Mollisia scopiformis]
MALTTSSIGVTVVAALHPATVIGHIPTADSLIQSRATHPALETRRLLFDGCSLSLPSLSPQPLHNPAWITNNGSVSIDKYRTLLFSFRR